MTKETQLKLLKDFYLPVIYGTKTFREYYVEEKKYTPKEAKQILNEKYEKFMTTLTEKGVQIIGKDVKIETSDSRWILIGVFVVQEPTGINKNIQMEEGKEQGF